MIAERQFDGVLLFSTIIQLAEYLLNIQRFGELSVTILIRKTAASLLSIARDRRSRRPFVQRTRAACIGENNNVCVLSGPRAALLTQIA